MLKHIGSYNNENGCYDVYWNDETREIIEDFGIARIIIGYAETEEEAIEYYNK